MRTGNVELDPVAEDDVVGVGECPVVDHEVSRQDELPLLHEREAGVELCRGVKRKTSVSGRQCDTGSEWRRSGHRINVRERVRMH